MSLNLTDAIFSQAEREPHAVAVIDAETVVDYRALCRGVCLAARRFRRAGWKAGDTIGVSQSTRPTLHLVSSLALARLGIAQAILPTSDSALLRGARLERLGISGLVSDDPSDAAGKVIAAIAPDPEWLKDSPGAGAPEDIRESGGERVWFIKETSGTTATPKLVGATHEAEDAQRMRLAGVAHLPGERFVNVAGMQFFTGLRRAFFCLSDGGTLTLPPAGMTSDRMLRWIDVHHVTYITCAPVHLHQLLRDTRTDSPRLPAVRILRSSSAALPASAVQEVRRRISPNLHILYGSSEGGPLALATPEMLDANPDTSGLPPPGLELEIVDERDEPVPHGTPGHIRVRGPGVLTSYLGAPQPERERVFRNGWFYPGDIAVRSGNGLLFHKGRSDEVMNFDGILVGPVEIESVLSQHPGVVEAAAFALPSPEHHEIPAAAIVSRLPIDSAELERFCAERLGIRAPRLFVQIDALPRNAIGKIQRNRLAELAMQKLRERGGSR